MLEISSFIIEFNTELLLFQFKLKSNQSSEYHHCTNFNSIKINKYY